MIGVFVVLGAVVALPMVLWAGGALYFDLPMGGWARGAVASAWLFGGPVLVVRLRRRARGALIVGGLFLLILAWWLTIQPRPEREWQADVARVSFATIAGGVATIHNVRNCEYRTETDYDARWEDRTFPLGGLVGVDIFICTWGSPWMAHPIVSFDFGGAGRVCFSIETRKEKGETYSALAGLYKQYELIYVAADERDVVRLRTNFRKGESAHLYRLRIPREAAMERFQDYVRRMNELKERPEFYNALTDNCTTSIRLQHDPAKRAPFDLRMLLNGRMDELLHERGIIGDGRAFDVVKGEALIDERAREAGDSEEFSELIRVVGAK